MEKAPPLIAAPISVHIKNYVVFAFIINCIMIIYYQNQIHFVHSVFQCLDNIRLFSQTIHYNISFNFCSNNGLCVNFTVFKNIFFQDRHISIINSYYLNFRSTYDYCRSFIISYLFYSSKLVLLN